MANTTSGSYVFDKNLGIDEIIEDAYERIGMQGVSGYQLKTAKRSLNILFSEWGNRGLQFWEVKNQNVALVDGQAVYTFYRSPSDGTSSGISTTLSAGINSSVTGLVEKPSVENAPSNLASIGRYVLTPDIFDILRGLPAGTGDEIQLADAINIQAQSGLVESLALTGERFDCGSIEGYLDAIVCVSGRG